MYKELWQRLTGVYDEDEAKAIVRLVLELRFGLSWADIVCGKLSELSAEDLADLEHVMQRLERGEPAQYVLGVAEFFGRSFLVNEHVLIPRPETGELCQWIIEEGRGASILDIGTGSGCIACTLAAEMPQAVVTAWDVSSEALDVARENAKRTHVNVSFQQVDILVPPSPRPSVLPTWDVIVSNPPYICEREKGRMERNVLEHEPHVALFVPDDDPLLFYRTIAGMARHGLTPGGCLFFEINPLYVHELADLLCGMSYHDIEIRNDQYGKPRMIKAEL